ncbi:MAG: branched-chain amino acid ABC transporter permease [Dehalococcoidia bacterium]|nr:branched-chain amino acid ABC transporter permease [Dehalococcoidia bacterium]
MIEAIIIDGLVTGAVFALLAVGFTLIYGVAGVTNLAHGSFFMLGAYMFSVFGPHGFLKLEAIQALILATIFVAIIASIFYRLSINPIIDDAVAVLVVTVSVAVIFQQIVLLVFGPGFFVVPPFTSGSTAILGLMTPNSRLVSAVISMALFISLWIFISRTKIGAAMRAVSQDREVAMLMGINTERLYMLTMAISAALAGIAGIFIASSTTGVAAASMWLSPLAMSFAIVILGGLGSIKGTLIGAFIIGYAESAVANLVPEGGAIVSVVPFLIMVLILVIRPKGLFGKRIEMEE